MSTIEHVTLKLLILRATHALTMPITLIEKACFAEPWEWREVAAFLSFADACANVHMDRPEPEHRPARIDHVAWVAMEGGKAVGHLLATIRDDSAQVHRLAVLPASRCQRIGHRLLWNLEKEAGKVGAESISIVVRERNTPGLVWLRQRGYLSQREQPITPAAFIDGEAGVTMAKPISVAGLLRRVETIA